MVKKDQEFPSDLLLLYGAKEIIYVDTMNLDGETNLKEKFVFQKNLDFNSTLALKGEIHCDAPNENLDEWDANIHFSGQVINCR